MRQLDAGRVTFSFKGSWDSNQAYEMFDTVKDTNGSNFTALKAVPSGTALTDEEYWYKLFDNSGEAERIAAEAQRQQAEVVRENAYEQIEKLIVPKYSVRWSGSSSAGVREDSAVGMVANVAVDDAIVQNDFDSVSFFDRPICCCSLVLVPPTTDVYKWRVNAYKGEPGFDWYGGNGELMYECKPFYWKADFEGEGAPHFVSVTGSPSDGYQLAPMFKNGHDKVYCPVFNLGMVNGVATSRAGLCPTYGSLNSLMANARTFNPGACTETIEMYFSDYLLQLVEFATKDFQAIMMGVCNLAYNTTTTVASVVSETVFKTSYTGLVIGQEIAIGSSTYGTNRTASDTIVDISVDADDSTLRVITLENAATGLTAGDYVSSRMTKTGKAALAVTNASSGSCVSNTDGKHPCIWRGKENPWSNGFSTLCNVLTKRYGDGSETPYSYKLYYLASPALYSNGAIDDNWVEANFNIGASDGYAKTMSNDSRYPFLFCTTEIGASSTTYSAAYYYYPRYDICAVRVGGIFCYGRTCGSYFLCSYAPSVSCIYYAARPYVPC